MAIKASLFLLVFITFFSCSNGPTPRSNKLSDRSPKNDWVKDKCGCQGLRNKDLAVKLMDENGLKNSSKEKFLAVFDIPDTVKNVGDKEVLVYFFNSLCKSGKILIESDRCYANFYFKSNKLTSADFTCE